MTQRLDHAQYAPELLKQYAAFGASVRQAGSIEAGILHLVDIRASQLNGCGFCLDMHIKQARIHGERELRLHHLAIWRDSPLFNARERAALEWTEALTLLSPHGVPDEAYAVVSAQYCEQERVELSYAVMAINGWNRLNIAFRTAPGSRDAAYGLGKANLS